MLYTSEMIFAFWQYLFFLVIAWAFFTSAGMVLICEIFKSINRVVTKNGDKKTKKRLVRWKMAKRYHNAGVNRKIGASRDRVGSI